MRRPVLPHYAVRSPLMTAKEYVEAAMVIGYLGSAAFAMSAASLLAVTVWGWR